MSRITESGSCFQLSKKKDLHRRWSFQRAGRCMPASCQLIHQSSQYRSNAQDVLSSKKIQVTLVILSHVSQYRRFSTRVYLAAKNQQKSTLEYFRAFVTRYPARIAVCRRSSSVARRISTYFFAIDYADYFATC